MKQPAAATECDVLITSSPSSLLEVVRMHLPHRSIAVFIEHTYCKIITEEPVTFVNKLSVVVPWSKMRALFYRGTAIDKTWIGIWIS